MIETQILKGNLIKQEHSLAFTLNQYDKNISYKINLIGLNGNSYTLDNEDIVTIEWLKPNGRPFLQSSNITKGDTYVTILIPEAVTQYAGAGSYNIIITNGGARKGTIKREYNVIGNSMRPGSVSEDVITDAITELRELSVEIADTVQNNQDLINNNQAATKQDIANVTSDLEEKANKTDVNDKFNKVNSDLEEKANKTDVANISSGTPLFVSSVSEMTDATRNYVNLTDGYLYIYNSTTSTFEKSTVQYQSTGISDESIDYNKLSFAKVGKNKLKLTPKTIEYAGTTINVFEDKIVINGTIDKTDAASYIVVTDNIKYVDSTKTYTLSCNYISGTAPSGLGGGLINKSPMVQLGSLNCSLTVATPSRNSTFSPTDATDLQYFWLVYPASGTFDNYTINIQLEEGNSQSDFEIYQHIFEDCDYVTNADIQNIKEKSENIPKINKYIMDGSLNLKGVFQYITTDASEDNQYEIYIPEGIYNINTYYTDDEKSASDFYGLFVPNYVTLKALGKKEDTILQYTCDTADANISTINLAGTSGLENLTIKGIKTRYACHDDFAYTDTYCKRNIINCDFIAEDTYYNVAYGSGLHNGAIWRFKDCKFISNKQLAFGMHSNVNFTIPGDVEFNNCKFISKGNCSIKFGGMASTVKNKVKMVGCQYNGIMMMEEVPGSGVGIDFDITGSNNNKGLYEITVTDGEEYMYNFADETPVMMADGAISKGKPVARNGFYATAHGTRDISRFYGVAMSTSTAANEEILVKTNGYVKISDTSLADVSLGSKIGIVSGDFAVVTTGDYIGICDITGYFRLVH